MKEAKMSEAISVMIETIDGRQFFFKKTSLKSLNNLIKTIKAKVYIVQTETKNIKSIKENIKLICNQSYVQQNKNFTVLNESVLSNKKTPSSNIREIIKQNFIKKQKISFKEIQYIFRKSNISASSLNQHFAQVRSSLSVQGIKIEKIKNGLYAIINA